MCVLLSDFIIAERSFEFFDNFAKPQKAQIGKRVPLISPKPVELLKKSSTEEDFDTFSAKVTPPVSQSRLIALVVQYRLDDVRLLKIS